MILDNVTVVSCETAIGRLPEKFLRREDITLDPGSFICTGLGRWSYRMSTPAQTLHSSPTPNAGALSYRRDSDDMPRDSGKVPKIYNCLHHRSREPRGHERVRNSKMPKTDDDGFEALLEPFYNGKKLTDPISTKDDKYQLLPAFLKVKGELALRLDELPRRHADSLLQVSSSSILTPTITLSTMTSRKSSRRTASSAATSTAASTSSFSTSESIDLPEETPVNPSRRRIMLRRWSADCEI